MLKLLQAQQAKTPEHNWQGCLLQFRLSQSQVDGVSTEPKPAFKELKQLFRRSTLGMTANHHHAAAIEFTLATV